MGYWKMLFDRAVTGEPGEEEFKASEKRMLELLGLEPENEPIEENKESKETPVVDAGWMKNRKEVTTMDHKVIKPSVLKTVMDCAVNTGMSKDDLSEMLANVATKDGGKGSGNFGHKGRPGQRGGSGEGEGGSAGSAERSSARRSVRADVANTKHEIETNPKYEHLKKYSFVCQSSATKPTKKETKAMMDKKLGNISNQLRPYAKQHYEKMVKCEPKITNDLLNIVSAQGGEMFGLPYRLKDANEKNGRCRIEDKIQEDMQDKGWSYEKAADNLGDIVRYTQACTADNLADSFEKTKSALEAKGYKCVKVKNTWDSFNADNAYRGVNTSFVSPDGVKFELQFHTAESLATKEAQHEDYEEWRTPGIDPQRKAELGRKMLSNANAMTRPKNIEKVKNYP